jgi:hypothetical protein
MTLQIGVGTLSKRGLEILNYTSTTDSLLEFQEVIVSDWTTPTFANIVNPEYIFGISTGVTADYGIVKETFEDALSASNTIEGTISQGDASYSNSAYILPLASQLPVNSITTQIDVRFYGLFVNDPKGQKITLGTGEGASFAIGETVTDGTVTATVIDIITDVIYVSNNTGVGLFSTGTVTGSISGSGTISSVGDSKILFYFGCLTYDDVTPSIEAISLMPGMNMPFRTEIRYSSGLPNTITFLNTATAEIEIHDADSLAHRNAFGQYHTLSTITYSYTATSYSDFVAYLATIPKHLTQNITITLNGSGYTGELRLEGFYGNGTLRIKKGTMSANYDYCVVTRNTCQITLEDLEFDSGTYIAMSLTGNIFIDRSTYVVVDGCTVNGPVDYGIYADRASSVYLVNNIIASGSDKINYLVYSINNAKVYVKEWTSSVGPSRSIAESVYVANEGGSIKVNDLAYYPWCDTDNYYDSDNGGNIIGPFGDGTHNFDSSTPRKITRNILSGTEEELKNAINSIGKCIPVNCIVDVTFANATYNYDNELYFTGLYGGGTLFFTGVAGTTFQNTSNAGGDGRFVFNLINNKIRLGFANIIFKPTRFGSGGLFSKGMLKVYYCDFLLFDGCSLLIGTTTNDYAEYALNIEYTKVEITNTMDTDTTGTNIAAKEMIYISKCNDVYIDELNDVGSSWASGTDEAVLKVDNGSKIVIETTNLTVTDVNDMVFDTNSSLIHGGALYINNVAI